MTLGETARGGKKRTCIGLTTDTGSILVRWTCNEKEDMRWLYNDSAFRNVPKIITAFCVHAESSLNPCIAAPDASASLVVAPLPRAMPRCAFRRISPDLFMKVWRRHSTFQQPHRTLTIQVQSPSHTSLAKGTCGRNLEDAPGVGL